MRTPGQRWSEFLGEETKMLNIQIDLDINAYHVGLSRMASDKSKWTSIVLKSANNAYLCRIYRDHLIRIFLQTLCLYPIFLPLLGYIPGLIIRISGCPRVLRKKEFENEQRFRAVIADGKRIRERTLCIYPRISPGSQRLIGVKKSISTITKIFIKT